MTTEELVKKREELLEKQRHIKGVVGDVFETTHGLFCTVIGIEPKNRIVEFEDGYITSTRLGNLKRGICENRYHVKVWGVGINTKGKHAAQVKGVGTKLYDLWTAMLARCYGSSKTHAYRDCLVDDQFLHFQIFAEWCTQQPNYDSGFYLDKDILVKNNKLYSADTCVFVPAEVNHFFTRAQKSRGKYPIGVHWSTHDEKFIAQINEGGKRRCLGRFNNPEDAFEKYRVEKYKQLKALIEKYENVLCPRVVEAMKNYKVEITD